MSETEDALVSLAADIIESISAAKALELAGGLPGYDRPRSRDWRHLGPLALGLAESANPDLPVTPDRPGHGDRRKHCEICGGTLRAYHRQRDHAPPWSARSSSR